MFFRDISTWFDTEKYQDRITCGLWTAATGEASSLRSRYPGYQFKRKGLSGFYGCTSTPVNKSARGVCASLWIYVRSHLSLRNKRGKVIKPLQYQSTVAPGTVARVEPNIKWFGKLFFLLSGSTGSEAVELVFLKCKYLGIVISALCWTDIGNEGKKTATVGKGIGSHLACSCT